METNRKCPRCGTVLPPNVPESQCPKCLLAVGLGTDPAKTAAAPAKAAPAVADLAKLFPQLEIIEFIGQGGMGYVYKARQPRLDRLVALKILPEDFSADPAFAERFTREARALAKLNHQNIVAVYDFGEAGGIYYFLMEYVDGLSLRQLERSGGLKPREALQIIPSICDALQYAHEQGIVHRDIKPENILLDKGGRAKIADFGLAKLRGQAATDPNLTRTQQIMGTPNYMAPEQFERPAEVDHRADIYSLGVVFYEMLTGELPIGRFAPPSQKVEVDVRLDQIVLRALEKERERRYQQASEVKSDVETVARPAAQAAAGRADSAAEQWREANQAVRGPALGIIATGIFNWVLVPLDALILITVGLFHYQSDGRFAGNPGAVLDAAKQLAAYCILAIMVLSSLMIFAGLKMKALESRPWGIVGSWLAILVSPGNIMGLPLGIWARVTLSRPQIKKAFQLKPPLDRTLPPRLSNQAAADPAPRWFFSTATAIMIGLAILFLLALAALGAGWILPMVQKLTP